jgi:hypothetical protein
VAVLAADARRAWDVVATGEVPPLLAAQVDGVLDDLDSAVASRSSADVRHAATELERAVLDMEMQYDDPPRSTRSGSRSGACRPGCTSWLAIGSRRQRPGDHLGDHRPALTPAGTGASTGAGTNRSA